MTLVLLVHSETSTGVVADIQALAAAAKEAGALVVVDAVSSLGAVPLETDAWGLDVVVSGSQKALMTPPGLGDCRRLRGRAGSSDAARPPSFYFDWERTRNAQAKLDAAFTPAVSLVVALDVALGLLLEEGLEAAFERHIRLGRACRAGVKAMGLELFSPDEDRSRRRDCGPRCRTGWTRPTSSRALRDRHGITIAGGQGELKGEIFRIGHIGWFDEFDITTALAAVELVLARARRATIERGVAVTARSRRTRQRDAGREEFSSARRSLQRASSCCARASTSTWTPTRALEEIIGGYDAIVIRSATKLTAELIERAERLKVIGRAGRRRRQRRRRRGDAARASSSRTRPSRPSSRPPSTRSGCWSRSPATSRRRTPR